MFTYLHNFARIHFAGICIWEYLQEILLDIAQLEFVLSAVWGNCASWHIGAQVGSSPNPFIAQCRDVRRVSGGGGSQIGLKLLRVAPPSQAGRHAWWCRNSRRRYCFRHCASGWIKIFIFFSRVASSSNSGRVNFVFFLGLMQTFICTLNYKRNSCPLTDTFDPANAILVNWLI